MPLQLISAQAFREAFQQHATETAQSRVAMQVHESLIESNAFYVVYVQTPTTYRACFLLNDDSELIHSVLHTGNKSGFWISPKRTDRTDWPIERQNDFLTQFGIPARAGHTITDWCVQNPDRVEELTEWLIQHGSNRDNEDLLGMSLEELRIEVNRPGSEVSAIENRRRLAQHLRRDRSPQLRRQKNLLFEEEHGYLGCEVCHVRADQPLDRSMIECHHVTPLGSLDQPIENRVDDLMCVCANCHRRIHATKDVDRNLAMLQERYETNR